VVIYVIVQNLWSAGICQKTKLLPKILIFLLTGKYLHVIFQRPKIAVTVYQ